MKMWKKLVAVAVFTVVMGGMVNAYGVENLDLSPEKPAGYENYWNCASRKLGRGISNAAFGALEIPIKIFKVSFEEGGIAGVTVGPIQGVGYFVLREVVGVAEILTFFMPLPHCNPEPYGVGWGFGPILEPEWIITQDTNWGNFVFPNASLMN